MKCVCPMGGDRTCPDDCPLAVWASLSPKDRKAQRKSIAERLYKDGFTREQIAKQLGVSEATIHRDLVNSFTMKESKPAKTARNPKGAGRHKSSKPPRPKPGEKQAQRSVNVRDDDWKRFKDKAEEEGKSAAAKLGELVLRDDLGLEVVRADLSMTAQEKLDAAIRQHKRKLDIEFEQRVLNECRERLNSMSLPHYAKQMQDMVRLITSRKGVMDKTTYNKIRFCLHPDHIQDPIMKRRHEEAFTIFNSLEKLLLSEKESPTEFRKLPTTYEELMAMKAKMQSERRAQRAAKSAPDRRA
jgi:hypothetical protein